MKPGRPWSCFCRLWTTALRAGWLHGRSDPGILSRSVMQEMIDIFSRIRIHRGG